MALQTFAPEPAPSPGTKIVTQPRVLKADFGDGYTQRTADGINHMARSLDLKWEFLDHEQAGAIIAFFELHGGYRSFIYKPVNSPGPLKWVCESWTDIVRGDGFRTITATIKQSFTLEN